MSSVVHSVSASAGDIHVCGLFDERESKLPDGSYTAVTTWRDCKSKVLPVAASSFDDDYFFFIMGTYVDTWPDNRQTQVSQH